MIKKKIATFVLVAGLGFGSLYAPQALASSAEEATSQATAPASSSNETKSNQEQVQGEDSVRKQKNQVDKETFGPRRGFGERGTKHHFRQSNLTNEQITQLDVAKRDFHKTRDALKVELDQYLTPMDEALKSGDKTAILKVWDQQKALMDQMESARQTFMEKIASITGEEVAESARTSHPMTDLMNKLKEASEEEVKNIISEIQDHLEGRRMGRGRDTKQGMEFGQKRRDCGHEPASESLNKRRGLKRQQPVKEDGRLGQKMPGERPQGQNPGRQGRRGN